MSSQVSKSGRSKEFNPESPTTEFFKIWENSIFWGIYRLFCEWRKSLFTHKSSQNSLDLFDIPKKSRIWKSQMLIKLKLSWWIFVANGMHYKYRDILNTDVNLKYFWLNI